MSGTQQCTPQNWGSGRSTFSFFFFFFLRSPAISLGFTTFGRDFCVCDHFFNPTIKVVTFRLHGWCVLGVFLLPAFTRLGHERQDLLSPYDGMHVCTTRPQFVLSSEGVFGGMEFEPMLTPREKSPLPKMSPDEARTRDTVDSEPKHYQLSYSGP